jgi:hypothetical protein
MSSILASAPGNHLAIAFKGQIIVITSHNGDYIAQTGRNDFFSPQVASTRNDCSVAFERQNVSTIRGDCHGIAQDLAISCQEAPCQSKSMR